MPNRLAFLLYSGFALLSLVPWLIHYFLIGDFSFRILTELIINTLLILALGIPLVYFLLEREEKKKAKVEAAPSENPLEELVSGPVDAGVVASAGLLLKYLLTKNKKIIEDQRKELDKLLIQDPLTELYNNSYFHTRMEEEIYKSQRQKYPLTLLMVQIDKFQEYRQTFGPKAADDMVKYVAKLLVLCTRERIDMLFRHGDTIFAAALPQTPEPGALVVANRMIQMVFDKTRRVTVSIGLLSIGKHSYNEAVSLAEKAMYEAASAGGGQARVYQEAVAQNPPSK